MFLHQAEQILLRVWQPWLVLDRIFLERQEFMDQLLKLLTLSHQVCGACRRGAAGLGTSGTGWIWGSDVVEGGEVL